MSTYDTTFVGAADGLTADNLLKPANGQIFLLERNGNNFNALQSTITDNSLVDLEGNGAVVANKFGVDITAPTITGLPSWGTGVESGATVSGKTVTFADAAGGAPKLISITATNGANITGVVQTYGLQTFDFVAPVNNTGSVVTSVITYSVTDNVGNTTTATQNVSIAIALPDSPTNVQFLLNNLSWDPVDTAVSYSVENLTQSVEAYAGSFQAFNTEMAGCLPGDELSIVAINEGGVSSLPTLFTIPA